MERGYGRIWIRENKFSRIASGGAFQPEVLCGRQSSVTRKAQQLRWRFGGPDGPPKLRQQARPAANGRVRVSRSVCESTGLNGRAGCDADAAMAARPWLRGW
eukprot:1005692-Pyramimonas_sp.AAC.1